MSATEPRPMGYPFHSIKRRSGSPLPTNQDSVGNDLSRYMIPWNFAPPAVTKSLALKLDQVGKGKDWKSLATRIGCHKDFIEVVPYRKSGEHEHSCTIFFFYKYAQQKSNSINEIREALIHLEIYPCVKIVDDAIPGIIKEYEESLESRGSNMGSFRSRKQPNVQDPSVDSSVGITNIRYPPDKDPDESSLNYYEKELSNESSSERDNQERGVLPRRRQQAVGPEDAVSMASTAVNYDAKSVQKLPVAQHCATPDTPVEYPADVAQTILLHQRYPTLADDDHSAGYHNVGAESEVKSHRSPSMPPKLRIKKSPQAMEHKRKMSHAHDKQPKASKQFRDSSPTPRASPRSVTPNPAPMDLSTNARSSPGASIDKVRSWLDSNPESPAGPRAVTEHLPRPPSGGFTAMQPHIRPHFRASPTMYLEEETGKAVFLRGSDSSKNTASCPTPESEAFRSSTSGGEQRSHSFKSYVPSGFTDNSVESSQGRTASTALAAERTPIDELAMQFHGLEANFNTVPRMTKAKAKGISEAIVDQTKFERSGTNYKTMPINAKPGPHKTASRKITAYVTYSYDNKDHFKSIIDLANNLKKNGFGVAVDSRDVLKELVPKDEEKEVNKIRYQKADYVVVCISPRYRKDYEESDKFRDKETIFTGSRGDSYNLHTKFIYTLMFQDLTQRIRSHRQFIVVLMSGGLHTDIPHWLRNSQVYCWPQDYLDINYYLSSPENDLVKFIHKYRQTNKSI